MNKKAAIFSFGIVSLCLVVSLCMTLSSIRNLYDYENESRIFDSIDDLSFIDEYVIKSPIIDSYKPYFSESKTATIEYNDKKINIFAYTFENIEHCVEYASNVSGNRYETLPSGDDISLYYYRHRSFLNMFQSEQLLIFSNEKAYVISAKIPEKVFNEFIAYFMHQLPVQVQMTY